MFKRLFSQLSFIILMAMFFAISGCEKYVVQKMVDLPPATVKKIVVEKDVMVPMRDGVHLATDIYRPKEGGPWPVVLVRIPYNKEEMMPILGKEIARRGYVGVIQDCRGTFKSEGRIFFPLFREADDGYDMIDWIVERPWCDGNIGMWGGSYFGYTQWTVAPDNPHLKCFFPLLTTPSMGKAILIGGAIQYEFTTTWTNSVGKQNQSISEQEVTPDLEGGYYNMPLNPSLNVDFTELAYKIENPGAVKKLTGVDVTYPAEGPIPRGDIAAALKILLPLFAYPKLIGNQKALFFGDDYEKVAAPAMGVAGWYDIFLKAQLEDFNRLWKDGRGDASKYSKIVIGPWGHGVSNGMASDYSKNAGDRAMINAFVRLDWFDRWLKNRQNGIENSAPVRIYVMGENKWRDENEWPLARAVSTRYYLHSSGKANGMNGDGTLSVDPPDDEQYPDRFVFDPSYPVPTRGGALLSGKMSGMTTQNDVEMRDDVLVYSTPPLEENVEVTGPLHAVIYASTTAVDTDWTVKLVEARADGTVVNIQDGIIRARYRNGPDNPRLLTPKKVYEYEVDLWATSYMFKKGNSIRIEVSSSNFPRFERNAGLGGRGGPPAFTVAHQSVYHEPGHASYIELPIIPAR